MLLGAEALSVTLFPAGFGSTFIDNQYSYDDSSTSSNEEISPVEASTTFVVPSSIDTEPTPDVLTISSKIDLIALFSCSSSLAFQ